MQWLNKIADELEKRHPKGQIIVSSGVTPSGIYHIGHLREVLTADGVYVELKRRGRDVRHLHIVDDLDSFRKVPANVPASFEKYLGKPLCDIPSPDEKYDNYADFFFQPFLKSVKELGVELEVVRAHKQYRGGIIVPAIEAALSKISESKNILETISNRNLDPHWNPVQVLEDGYLKNRKFLRIDTKSKIIHYEDLDGNDRTARYDKGEVKLDWRLDWPARWMLLGVDAEPFGRDHATKGGSYDTGVGLVKEVFNTEPPLPIPYDFINRTGDTKKMSASKGTGIEIKEALEVLPPEVLRYFIFRFSPSKLLNFDSGAGAIKLVDDFAALSAKKDLSDTEEQLLFLSTLGYKNRIVSRVPFSHLVASYQAALKDADKTIEIMIRTEHKETVEQDKEIIKKELKFIDAWLKHWADDDVKFELSKKVNKKDFTTKEIEYLNELAEKIERAPADADGEWFHKAIYDFKDKNDLQPKELFQILYKVIISKSSGPRAGWFLSILPRDWLIKRLRLEE